MKKDKIIQILPADNVEIVYYSDETDELSREKVVCFALREDGDILPMVYHTKDLFHSNNHHMEIEEFGGQANPYLGLEFDGEERDWGIRIKEYREDLKLLEEEAKREAIEEKRRKFELEVREKIKKNNQK